MLMDGTKTTNNTEITTKKQQKIPQNPLPSIQFHHPDKVHLFCNILIVKLRDMYRDCMIPSKYSLVEYSSPRNHRDPLECIICTATILATNKIEPKNAQSPNRPIPLMSVIIIMHKSKSTRLNLPAHICIRLEFVEHFCIEFYLFGCLSDTWSNAVRLSSLSSSSRYIFLATHTHMNCGGCPKSSPLSGY